MIGAIIVTLIVCVIVISYMVTVNWFLRGDEHYNDDTPAKPSADSAGKTAQYANGIPARA